MNKLIIIFIYLFAIVICYGNDNNLINRKSFTLKLAVNDSNFYQTEIKSSPFILPENTIQMYPGEKIFVEVELGNKTIKSMKSVKENLNPDKTIIISFSQDEKDKKHELMMLSIDNPFNYNLEYKANIFLMEHNKWINTNVLPVEAKLASYETWPDIIVTIALSEWIFN